MLRRKRDAARRDDRRPQDAVRAAITDRRQNQLPFGVDQRKDRHAGSHARHAHQNDASRAESFGPTACRHSDHDGRDGIDEEEQADSGDAEFGGIGPQEGAWQPQSHAHSNADHQDDAGAMAEHEGQQRGFAREQFPRPLGEG